MTQRVESYKRTCRSLLAIPTAGSDRAVWAGQVDITLLRVRPTDVLSSPRIVPRLATQPNHLLIESPEVLDLDRFLRTIHDTSDFNVLALMLS
jgi:hypothetical protein